MSDWLTTHPLALFAAITITVTVVSIVVRGIWKAARWVERMESKTSGANRFMEDTSKFMEEIRDEMRQIRSHINNVFVHLSQTVKRGSPVQLTEFGKEVAKSLQADEWASEVASSLAKKLEGKRPFEIDDYSRTYVVDELSNDAVWKTRIAGCAYEFGIEQAGVLAVMQVVLRDTVLRVLKEKEDGTYGTA